MKAFNVVTGLAAPLDRSNVDTDAIIPKQYLKSIRRTGFGPFLFDDWRYLTPGDLGVDLNTRQPNAEFVLNQLRYAGAEILLARRNFGCGSSREHAVWALADYGFRAVIAPSYADIFFNNCFKNGVLPVILSEAEVEQLFREVEAHDAARITVNLPDQTVTSPGGAVFRFEVDAFRKECLINGWDDIGLTLRQADAIRAYEQKRAAQAPWLFQ